MARHLIPSSFECECGHQSHFFERTINEMEAGSRRAHKPIRLSDSEPEEHAVEFEKGRATAIVCSKLGRCEIKSWA
jgi:hypothetical protein